MKVRIEVHPGKVVRKARKSRASLHARCGQLLPAMGILLVREERMIADLVRDHQELYKLCAKGQRGLFRVQIGHTHPRRNTEGLASLKYDPSPVIVPEVPIPAQITVISGSCFKICGPVHLICDCQFASFSY